jgi:hypothetical protein
VKLPVEAEVILRISAVVRLVVGKLPVPSLITISL